MATRPAASAAIVTVSIEILVLGLMVLAAGTNRNLGKVLMVFVIGLGVLAMVAESNTIAGIGNVFTAYLGNPTNSAANTKAGGAGSQHKAF